MLITYMLFLLNLVKITCACSVLSLITSSEGRVRIPLLERRYLWKEMVPERRRYGSCSCSAILILVRNEDISADY